MRKIIQGGDNAAMVRLGEDDESDESDDDEIAVVRNSVHSFASSKPATSTTSTSSTPVSVSFADRPPMPGGTAAGEEVETLGSSSVGTDASREATTLSAAQGDPEAPPLPLSKIAAKFIAQRPIDFGDAWEIVERARRVQISITIFLLLFMIA